MTFKNFQGILNSTLTNEQGEIWVLFIVDGVQKFYLNATKIKNELNKVKKNMPCEVNFTVFFDANYIPELVAIQELNSGTYLSRSLFINKKYEDLKDSDNDSKKNCCDSPKHCKCKFEDKNNCCKGKCVCDINTLMNRGCCCQGI